MGGSVSLARLGNGVSKGHGWQFEHDIRLSARATGRATVENARAFQRETIKEEALFRETVAMKVHRGNRSGNAGRKSCAIAVQKHHPPWVCNLGTAICKQFHARSDESVGWRLACCKSMGIVRGQSCDSRTLVLDYWEFVYLARSWRGIGVVSGFLGQLYSTWSNRTSSAPKMVKLSACH
jgi:hypothetical protein